VVGWAAQTGGGGTEQVKIVRIQVRSISVLQIGHGKSCPPSAGKNLHEA